MLLGSELSFIVYFSVQQPTLHKREERTLEQDSKAHMAGMVMKDILHLHQM